MILHIYKDLTDSLDFKNVSKRVYTEGRLAKVKVFCFVMSNFPF